jgi:hypothetical protein
MRTPARSLRLRLGPGSSFIDRRLVEIIVQFVTVAGFLVVSRLTITVVPPDLRMLWSVSAAFIASALVKLAMPRHTILSRVSWLGTAAVFVVLASAAFFVGRPWFFGLWSPLAWLAVVVAYGCVHFAFLARLGDDEQHRSE